MNARGCSKAYIKICSYRFTSLLKQTSWQFLKDINLDSFYIWRSKQKLAAKTLNEYAILLQAFLNWMERKGAIIKNPFKYFTRIETNGREVRQRRAFSDEELARLVSIQSERRIVYLTAVSTGLRRGELAALRWDDIRFDVEKPYIQVRAAISKNKKNASTPLHRELVAELKKLKTQSSTEKVFESLMPKMRQFRKDLETAGITYKDELGRQADFHALRKTLATNLNKMGVAPRTAMEVMRHSDIKLTMKNYTDSSQLPTFAAIEQLPWFNPPVSKDTQIDSQILDTTVHNDAQPDTTDKKADTLEASIDGGSWHVDAQSDTMVHTEQNAPKVGLEYTFNHHIPEKAAHILAIDIKEPIDPHLSREQLFEEIHKQGGVAIVAHPGKIQRPQGFLDRYLYTLQMWKDRKQYRPLNDGMEIANCRNTFLHVSHEPAAKVASNDFHKPE